MLRGARLELASDSLVLGNVVEIGSWQSIGIVDTVAHLQAFFLLGPAVCSEGLIEARQYAEELVLSGISVRVLVPTGPKARLQHFAKASRIDAPFYEIDPTLARGLFRWGDDSSSSPQIAFVDPRRRQIFFRIGILNVVTSRESKLDAISYLASLQPMQDIESQNHAPASSL